MKTNFNNTINNHNDSPSNDKKQWIITGDITDIVNIQ